MTKAVDFDWQVRKQNHDKKNLNYLFTTTVRRRLEYFTNVVKAKIFFWGNILGKLRTVYITTS